MRQNFYLAFNATSGTSRGAAVARLKAHLEKAGASVTLGDTATPQSARAGMRVAARSGRFDALLACGGDGTIRQAAAAAAGTECPVGCFMLGTGNVLAHELGLPRGPEASAELFLHGVTIDVGMGLANDDPFLLMAGVGFDGRVISALNQRLKQSVAKAAYVPATLTALRPPIDNLTVEIDGHTHTRVAWAIITSASRYGGAFWLTRRTELTRESLVAILFYATRKTDLIRHSLNIARGRLDQIWHHVDSDVFMTACNDARITSGLPVPVQVDGDAFGTTPLHIAAKGPRVKLIVPAR